MAAPAPPVVPRDAAPAADRAPRPAGKRICRVLRPGPLDYTAGLALQARLVRRVQAGGDEALVLCEHPPVVTVGRGSDPAHLLGDAAFYASRGIGLHEAGRGGDVTYHGPGQLVGYPILDLSPDRRDLHRYLRDLEEVLLGALADLGVAGARRIEGLTGVFVGGEKIAALGVRVSRWVTSHGFALNVSPDLSAFSLIVPCGLHDRGVTSLERLLGRRPDAGHVAERVAHRFARVFRRCLVPAAAPSGDGR